MSAIVYPRFRCDNCSEDTPAIVGMWTEWTDATGVVRHACDSICREWAQKKYGVATPGQVPDPCPTCARERPPAAGEGK